MRKTPTYQRLSRALGGMGSYRSLWLASDHLLVVTSTGYSEEYNRIDFRDIRGFFVIASGRRFWWAAAYGVLAIWPLLSGIDGVLYSSDTPWVSLCFLLLLGVLFLWNHRLGEGCVASVVTGVQTLRLPSVSRAPKARKILVRLKPIILEAQAGLAGPAPDAPAPDAPAAGAPAPDAPPPPAAAEGQGPSAPSPGAVPPVLPPS